MEITLHNLLNRQRKTDNEEKVKYNNLYTIKRKRLNKERVFFLFFFNETPHAFINKYGYNFARI